MTSASVKKAKKDIISFFYDEDRQHWIYKYGNNVHSNVSGNNVFYLSQLRVLFEEKSFHWNTGYALNELVDEGQLINWKEKSQKIDNASVQLSLYRRPDTRYYKKNTKILFDCVKFFTENFNKACGKWAEFLTEHFFLLNGFKIIDKHTNSFNGNFWKNTDHNLDLIVTKDELNYGIEVKNRFEYIGKKEFRIKMYDMCSYLDLIPVCVSRFAPYFTMSELGGNGGRILIFKRKVFPFGFEQQAKKIWESTLLPIRCYDRLSEKSEYQFIKWHNQNVKNYH